MGSTTTPPLAAERPGSARTPCPCGATGRRLLRLEIWQAFVSAGFRSGRQTATIFQCLWRVRWLEDRAKATIPCITGRMLVLMGGNEKPTFNRIGVLILH